MSATPLGAIVTTDLVAVTRGRFLPAAKIASAETGIGWVPANISLKADGHIAASDFWGSSGDLRILPDLAARAVTGLTGAPTPFDMTPGDIVTLDGAPWAACARGALKAAIAEFEAATGYKILASFEQEFQIFGADFPKAHVFSYQALRRAEPWAGEYFAALSEAGVDPEVIISEYGEDQYEITTGPTGPLAAADRCVIVREITREMARLKGWRASFAPKTHPDASGNGVHIHFSLTDAEGRPVSLDPARPGRLSTPMAAFCAGIVHHMPAILALTAAHPSSFIRLKPHNWSSAWTWLGDRDREASLRICPTADLGGRDVSRAFNVEYRAADATANPYLALAALIRAGTDGILEKREAAVHAGDPEALSPEARAALGLHRLPETLGQALDRLEESAALAAWFAPELLRSFLGVKRAEIEDAEGLDDVALCARTASQY